MNILPFTSPRGCLSYILVDETARVAALIDPSEEIALETYLGVLNEHGATLTYVVETHTHADHISSAPDIVSRTGAKIVRHAGAPSTHKDIAVHGGEQLQLGTETLSIMATPGHTNESISISTSNAVFTGDALLIGGTGRTDFQAGDSEALYDSLHTVLGNLPDATRVYPAHDYAGRVSSTLGTERSTNPRFALTRAAFIKTMDAHHPAKPELFDEAVSTNSF